MCYYCGRCFHVCECVLAVSSAVSVISNAAQCIETFTTTIFSDRLQCDLTVTMATLFFPFVCGAVNRKATSTRFLSGGSIEGPSVSCAAVLSQVVLCEWSGEPWRLTSLGVASAGSVPKAAATCCLRSTSRSTTAWQSCALKWRC